MPSIDHILILTPGFPKDETDDVCIPYFQDYLQLLQAACPSLRVTVIAFQYPFHSKPYTWHGHAIRPLGGRNQAWRKLFVWRKAKRVFAAIHRAHPVNAIHSLWLNETAWVGGKLARKYQLPHVATLMGQDALPQNRWLKKLDFKTMRIAALSQRSADEFEKNSGIKVDALLPFAEPARPSIQMMQRDVDVLGVGSFIPSKKFDRFLRVVRMLADRRPHMRVVLLGSGPEEKALKNLSQELGLEGVVEFAGQQSRAGVFAWMQRSHVFLHPSLQEGQCYVFVEALNRGMQVVSSPIGVAESGPDWVVQMDAVRMAEGVEAFLTGTGPDATTYLALNAEVGKRLVEGYLAFYRGGKP